MKRNPGVYLMQFLVFAMFTAGLVPDAYALGEDKTIPSAEAILEQHIAATGGRVAYEKIRNRVTKGTLEMPAQGITIGLTIVVARPNLVYSRAESEVTGPIEKGTDGRVAWEKSVMTGPRILEGQEREDFLREAAFDKFVRWRDFYEKAESAGLEDVGGRSCYKIVLTPKNGKPQTLFLDRETALIVKLLLTVDSPMGSVPVETTLEDYRESDGILLSRKTRSKVLGQERVFTVTSIEHNVDLPPDRFLLPADIQELLAKQAAGPALQR